MKEDELYHWAEYHMFELLRSHKDIHLWVEVWVRITLKIDLDGTYSTRQPAAVSPSPVISKLVWQSHTKVRSAGISDWHYTLDWVHRKLTMFVKSTGGLSTEMKGMCWLFPLGGKDKSWSGCIDRIPAVFYVGEDVGPACESGVIDWSLTWGQASQEVCNVYI